MTRIERLAALIEEPLLVAGPPYVLGGQANVRYLTGLQSSNSALLVAPDASATLYADFRYAARGREIDGVTFVETPRGLLSAIGELLAGRRIGFEEAHLSYSGYRALVDAGVDAVPRPAVVESLRAVKDDAEIEIMRRAGALSDDIFTALTQERFTGRTERELVWWVERSFRDAGAEGVKDADSAARSVVDEAGLGEAFGHGLGHGVGIQIHEAPVLRPESTDVLERGNVVSVEPGIYLPGEGGVRIEDLVLVTGEGRERLTQFTKELIAVE